MNDTTPALFRRIGRVPAPLVRPLPDADIRAPAHRDPTDLSPVFPLRVSPGWYAAHWYGDRPERRPVLLPALRRLLARVQGAMPRPATADRLPGGHPAGAR